MTLLMLLLQIFQSHFHREHIVNYILGYSVLNKLRKMKLFMIASAVQIFIDQNYKSDAYSPHQIWGGVIVLQQEVLNISGVLYNVDFDTVDGD